MNIQHKTSVGAVNGPHASEVGDVPVCKNALGGGNAGNIEAELRDLHCVLAQMRENQAREQRRNDLLEGIIGHLPVGLSVQDEHGRFVFVNDAAAPSVGVPTAEQISPAAQLIETEESIAGPDGERIWLTRRKPVRILDQTLTLSTSLDITERKRLEGELVRRVYSDELTGLANRAMIQERVEGLLQAKGSGDHIALAFIDLDNFKHINDYYSHHRGCIAGGGCPPHFPRSPRVRHAGADQRRRIRAVGQSGGERGAASHDRKRPPGRIKATVSHRSV